MWVKDSVPKFSVSHVAYLNKDVDTDTLKDKVLYMDTREQALNEVLVATKRAQGGLSVAGGCRCLTKELDMIAC